MDIRLVTWVMAATLGASVPASAQTNPTGTTDLRLSPGIVGQSGIFGDDDPQSTGWSPAWTIGFQARMRNTHTAGFSFETMLQPVGVRNPHFDETLHSVYALAGVEIGRRFFVRPAGGIALQVFAGSHAVGPSLGLALSTAVGWRQPLRNGMHLAPEFVIRGSGSPGAAHSMIGAQISIGW